MNKARLGISAMVGLLVVVVIIGGAFFVAIPMVANSTSTSTTGTTSVTTSNTNSTSGSSGSTGKLTFNIAQPLIVAPGANESVSLKFTAIGTVSGTYTLAATSLPKGVSASFNPSTIDLPSQLQSAVTMTLSATSGATVDNATVNVEATAGSSVFTQPFSLMSVQALVFIQGNAFVPNSLTVAAGTKVYWLNLDAGGGEAGGAGGGHDVTATDGSFSSGTGNMVQYSIYTHTFTTAGTVKYQSAAQSFTGQIIVH